ncbi:MAG TPA: hypothetical protein VN643_08035 [Pyrinomonadaceae bacterium]|nr:hypothetical protein [Pyrinomonadaceae bacterium]
MIEIRFLPAVLEDAWQAAERYDKDGYEGLGDRFLSVFYSYALHLQHHGKAYRVIYKSFWRVLLNPFPYALYYRAYREWLVVALVIHTARSPRLVRKVLRQRLTLNPEQS